MEDARWSTIVESLVSRDVDACAEAAGMLHAEATVDDVPRLLELLQSDDSFVREAAAWPLAELAGTSVLDQLFAAYQRGFDEGHDNDAFTAALLEIPALHPTQSRQTLLGLVELGEEPAKGHAAWLLTFCAAEGGNDASQETPSK
jgi:HEAT repeat protein